MSAWLVLLSGMLLGAPLSASDQPVVPRDCEAWQSEVQERTQADDDLTRELAEFYASPGQRYCQQRLLPVRQASDTSFDFAWPNWDIGLARLVRLLAILVLVVLVVWLIVRLAQFDPALPERETQQQARRRALSDDAEPEPDLPEDVVGQAQQHWQAGRHREALSLLYQGAVKRLLPDQPHRDSLTESEVLAWLRRVGAAQEQRRFMRDLSRTWLRMAWQHQRPNDKRFQQLITGWKASLEPGGNA